MLPRMHNTSGQAMIEAAILLPVLLVLYILAVDFGLRMENQARAAMAARYGAFLGSSGRYDTLEDEVRAAFFPADAEGQSQKNKNNGDPWYTLKIDKEHKKLSDMGSHGGGIMRILSEFLGAAQVILPDDWFDDNVKVTVTYSQKPLGYAPARLLYKPGNEGGGGGDKFFLFHTVTTKPLTVYWINYSETWDKFGFYQWIHGKF